jgi:hypothetical protein
MNEDNDQGHPGESGQPGEQGLPARGREGGPGGKGGGGGKGGAGQPEGPGGAGGTGGGGGKGAQGEQGPPGEQGEPGKQPKLRWAPAVGYLLLALVLGSLGLSNWNRGQENKRLIEKNDRLVEAIAEHCVDPQASAALRVHVKDVIEIIKGTQQTKPGQPGYIPPKDASKRFVASYEKFGRNMGPAPDCYANLPP